VIVFHDDPFTPFDKDPSFRGNKYKIKK